MTTATNGRTTAAERKAAEAAAAERAAAERTGEPELIADAVVELAATVERTMPATLVEALAALQGMLPDVNKGATAEVQTKNGGKYTYRYAGLDVITEALMPVLSSVGLSFTSKPTMTRKRGFILKYKLSHIGGEVEPGWWPLPDPTAVDDRGRPLHTPQEIGSAITYARRYALTAVTGLAPSADDDDGKAATQAVQDRRDAEPPPPPLAGVEREQKIEEFKGLLREAGDVDTLKAAARAIVASGLAEDDQTALRELYGDRMDEIAKANLEAGGLVGEDQQAAQAPDDAGAQAADRAVTDEATDGQTPADASA
jgi:hypothetical protein